MATIENLTGHEQLLERLRAMNEGELAGQQISQQGAIHAVTFLLANGCTEALAIEMPASLRKCMETVAAVAEEKGYQRLFDDSVPNFN